MGYTKYGFQVVKLDHRPYYPRADKPMNMVIKEWEKAILVSRMWHSERMRGAYFMDQEVAKAVRPTIRMEERLRGASFTTAEMWENVPNGDNESDLNALARESKRRYNEATIENTASRIKMMLGMLGDVQEEDSKEFGFNQLYLLTRTAHDYKVFTIKGQKLVLIGESV